MSHERHEPFAGLLTSRSQASRRQLRLWLTFIGIAMLLAAATLSHVLL